MPTLCAQVMQSHQSSAQLFSYLEWVQSSLVGSKQHVDRLAEVLVLHLEHKIPFWTELIPESSGIENSWKGAKSFRRL